MRLLTWLPLLLTLASPAAAAPRVASLLPWATDAVARTVGPDAIVATVRSRPDAAPAIGADLGSPHSPNLEGLAAARPELVLADAMMHRRMEADLRASGAEILWLDGTGVDDTFAALERIGAAIGAAEPMEIAVGRARAEVAAAQRDAPLRMLALFGTPGRFFVITRRHWIGDLAARVGFELELAQIPEDPRFPGLLPVSDEHLVTLRPEIVALVAHGDPAAIAAAFEQKLARGGAWKPLRDAATHGVHVLDARHFAANPGLAMGAAAERLAGLDARPVAARAERP